MTEVLLKGSDVALDNQFIHAGFLATIVPKFCELLLFFPSDKLAMSHGWDTHTVAKMGYRPDT